jgi:hypothetical protein
MENALRVEKRDLLRGKLALDGVPHQSVQPIGRDRVGFDAGVAARVPAVANLPAAA